MKWPWESLFEYIYGRYVKLLAETNWLKKELDKLPIIMGDFEWDTRPTQQDKMSPHSHMPLNEVYVRLARAYSSSEGFQRFKVQNTNSMEPWIDDNTIVVGSTNLTDLTKGDVVIYRGVVRTIPLLIVHRIKKISASGKSFYIRGDNNFYPDGWVRIEKIVWRVVNVGYAQPQRDDD